MKQEQSADVSREAFEALLEETMHSLSVSEGTVVSGTIVGVDHDFVSIDVGLKMEGRVPVAEFNVMGEKEVIAIGTEVEVFLERYENNFGEAVISRDRARREESWTKLEKGYNENKKVRGAIVTAIKGGFSVDLDGVLAFLPRSQIDTRPVRDIQPLLNKPDDFLILKMDRRRGNVVVSRRAVLEESRAELRSELIEKLKEDQIVEGVVKNITDYGAFVDLGGIDGLLHVTDMAWQRVNRPSDVVKVGDTVKVRVIRIDGQSQRISLGIKQLQADPWENVSGLFEVNKRYTGRVTNITDYGAFVELTPGIEGLIHITEMSWLKKNVLPAKVVSSSQEVEVMILEIDQAKRRISLGLKQCLENPWQKFLDANPVGSKVSGTVKNKTEFGLFIGLEGDVDGLVHLTDIDWGNSGDQALEKFEAGQSVDAIVSEVSVDKERINLSIKHLSIDPVAQAEEKNATEGSVVTCEVLNVKEGGLDVKIVDTDIIAFIRRAEIARDRSEQRPERFAPGDRVDARITAIDKRTRKFSLSIKAREIEEEKQAVEQYGSADSGASLGEILGVAIEKAARAKADHGAQGDEEAADSQILSEDAPTPTDEEGAEIKTDAEAEKIVTEGSPEEKRKAQKDTAAPETDETKTQKNAAEPAEPAEAEAKAAKKAAAPAKTETDQEVKATKTSKTKTRSKSAGDPKA